MEKRNYQVRAGDNHLIVEGTAIVFDSPAKVGNYTEKISRSALKRNGFAQLHKSRKSTKSRL